MAKNVPLGGVRGMKEVFHEWPTYRYIVQNFTKQVETCNYRRVIPNIVEHEDTFNKSLGVQSDIVLKEMYKVLPLSETAAGNAEKRKLVLRPEGTATTLKFLCSDPNVDLTQVNKTWYWGPMFRYERP